MHQTFHQAHKFEDVQCLRCICALQERGIYLKMIDLISFINWNITYTGYWCQCWGCCRCCCRWNCWRWDCWRCCCRRYFWRWCCRRYCCRGCCTCFRWCHCYRTMLLFLWFIYIRSLLICTYVHKWKWYPYKKLNIW